jgi:glycosyltransferase involved in cell wall biosynthesis
MPTVSVIIPTRERCDTLEYALRSVTAVDDDGLEILVSDNASQDETRDVVEAANDPRIRYVNTGERMGMSENWEFALSRATGDWVGFIGDDDGILPGGIARLRQVISEGRADAVKMASCHYEWPSAWNTQAGLLVVPVERSVRLLRTKPAFAKMLDARGCYPDLPGLYHGRFAKRSLIEAARAPSGRFFNSQIPDVYSAVILALKTDRYVSTDLPVALHGLSKNSTGQSMLDHGTRNERNDLADMFAQEAHIPLHAKLAVTNRFEQVKTFHLLVIDAILHAQDAHPDLCASDPLKLLQGGMVAAKDTLWVSDWANRFAAANGIPTDIIGDGMWRLRAGHFLWKLGVFLSNTHWYSTRAPGLRLPNVAVAARVAERVWQAAPSPTANRVLNVGRRLREKFSANA